MVLNSLKKLCFVFFLWAGWIIPQNASAQQLNQNLSSDSVSVGDVVELSLTIDHDTPYDEIIYPDSSDFGELFEIRSRERHDVSEYKDSLVYELQFFGTSDTTLPSLPIYLRSETETDTLYTESEPIYFKTVLEAEEEDFRPFKPIFDFAANWWPWFLAFLVLVLAGWWLYKKYRQTDETGAQPPAEFSPTPFKDPLKDLSKRIARLHNTTFDSQQDFEDFYIALGDAIRTYFEDLYHIPALESTSGEILRDLQNRSVDHELISHTRRVLNEADMVKFARFTPTEEQANKALNKADAFLKKVRNLDGPKVEQLRREHYLEIEQKREEFERKQQVKEEQSK